MGRWILTLFASLLAALPFFKRARSKPGARSADGKSFLPSTEAGKLSPIWEGFGDTIAAQLGASAATDASAVDVAPSTRDAAAEERRSSQFVRWSAATPWILGAATLA